MLKLLYSSTFKKDIKRAVSRGLDLQELKSVTDLLQAEQSLPPEYHDHPLHNTNKFKNVHEYHINPDWLLIYKVDKEILAVRCERTGTHSDLYG